jgi:hypothetical protein
MPIDPTTWNAVVIGAWNRAILTPDGVRRRLFELPEGTPVELEVPVDQPGPFRVGHDGLIVIPALGRLEVSARTPSLDAIRRASVLCQRALVSLPETPISAAGVNIAYRLTEIPDAVLDLVRAPLDEALSDAGYEVRGALTRRSVVLPPGVVNVQVVQKRTGGGTLEFNFHRESTVPNELREWLARTEEFVDLSDRLALVAGVPDVRREIHA